MAKDRSRPFSRKHFRYWMTVTGGMLLIGGINVAAGWLMWPGEPPPTQPIILDIPTRGPATPPDATLAPDAAVTPSGS